MAKTYSPARVRIRPRTSVTVTTPSRSCTPPTRSFRWLVITACLPYLLDKRGLRCHSARGPTPHLHHCVFAIRYHTTRPGGGDCPPIQGQLPRQLQTSALKSAACKGTTVSYR